MLQPWAHHCGAMVCNHVPRRHRSVPVHYSSSFDEFLSITYSKFGFWCQICKNADVKNDLAYKVSLCFIFRLIIANVTWSDGNGKAQGLVMRVWYCQWILGQFGTICANIWCQQQTRVCLLSVMQFWNLHFLSMHCEIQIDW